ncbi:MAG: hypothetical protein V7K48_19290 [Nostoc sp.]|uniref:hypothetical protein n=1 Tax=Nostoc sp. TaxID=1180 RepID=UPI002FF59516
MATLIPSSNSRSMQMTPGERRLAQRLEEKLEDDYLLWYDVPVSKKRVRSSSKDGHCAGTRRRINKLLRRGILKTLG